MKLSRREFLKATGVLASVSPLLLRSRRTAEAVEFPICVGVFADSEARPTFHRTDQDGKTEDERLGEICDDAAALGAVALVGVGDLINESSESFDTFLQVTEALGRTVPVQYVFGNHDHWENYERGPILSHYGLTKMYRYIDLPGKVRLIFLADENTDGTANSNISPAQAEWFATTVHKARRAGRMCIVFSHQPRYDTIASSRSPGIFLAESGGSRDLVEATVGRCAAMFSGHVQLNHDFNRTRIDPIATQQRRKDHVWYFGLQSVIPSGAHLPPGVKEPDGTCWHHEYRIIKIDATGVYEHRRNFRTRKWIARLEEIP